jgi:cytosine permease
MLPDYLAKAVPNPIGKRAPWYANTAPSYAGIFLWIAFYQQMAGGTLQHGGLGLCLVALAVAGILSYALFYRVPAMLGMKTGFPLYVVGSSTFGTAGGYVMPGLLMGLLQIGWFGVGTFFAADYILRGLGVASEPRTLPFGIACLLWGGAMAWVGAKGIQYVAKIGLFLNSIPLLMLLVVLFQTSGGIAKYQVAPAQESSFGAFTMMIAIVIGFFATAGAAGTDFGMNSRNESDVRWGGLVGITLAVMVAGGLSLMAVAGAHGSGLTGSWDFGEVVQAIGGPIASAMLFLFAIASIPASCFCAFIAGNSFNTMIPSVPRVSSTMAAGAVGVLLAITGVAANLTEIFGFVGASFGPIIGAMVADYLLAGKKWSGPREGVNLAGYIAWAVGFIVGILPSKFSPLSPEMKSYVQPAVVYSFLVGFVVYFALAKAGLQSKTVEMPKAA